MKLLALVIAINTINGQKGTGSTSHLENSEFFDALTERRKPQVDDIYYNVNELQRLSNQGVDISNLMVADGIESGKKRKARGTLEDNWTYNDWTQTDHGDDKIVIAWSVMEHYPYENETTEFMASISKDLGCIKTVKVERSDLATTEWTQGIMFLWETHTEGGCWSALGQNDGFTGSRSLISFVNETGAPETWQIIAMAAKCGGDTAATVHHEVLHALGVGHEHNRPDRDDYLTLNLENSSKANQYYKIEKVNWLDTGYPFELDSVMTYCSFCSSNNSLPVATLKDNSTFGDGLRLTTTDALQIQNKYCKMKDSSFIYKEHLMCDGKDAVGLDRPVFVDRYCDNFLDCANGSDEDGSVIQCDKVKLTENGCCETYVMDGEEFTYGGINRGRDYFNNTNSDAYHKHLVFYPNFGGDKWYRVVWPIDEIVKRISYKGYAISNATCPPTNAIWSSGTAPICKSLGPIMTDHCARNNCHADANCSNNLESFTCTCNYGYVGDGLDCEALPVEDECAIGNNDCDPIGGVCTDTEYSYTCSCDIGFWDKNPNHSGRQCDGCCQTLDLVHKTSNTTWTSCKLNTTAVSQGGDKWVYECDNDYLLEYLDWSGWKNWVILTWKPDRSISLNDHTTKMGSDAHAEGKCFPPSITFESKYNPVCTSRFDDNLTTPAPLSSSTLAQSTQVVFNSTEVSTSLKVQVITSKPAAIISLETQDNSSIHTATTPFKAPEIDSTQKITTLSGTRAKTSTEAPVSISTAREDMISTDESATIEFTQADTTDLSGHQTTIKPTTAANFLTTNSNVSIFSESDLKILTQKLEEKESVISSQFEMLNLIEANAEQIEKRLDIMRDVIITTKRVSTTSISSTISTKTSFTTSTIFVAPCNQIISTCGSWTSWSSISSCSVTCGEGLKTWERCFDFTDDIHPKCEIEPRPCSNNSCPGWAKWSIWGPCSSNCRRSGEGSPKQDRYRCWDTKTSVGIVCDSGEEDNKNIQSESRDCNSDEYCHLECEWQEWSHWGDCNPDCNQGIKLRRRINNEEQGAWCDPNDSSLESQVCSDNSVQCATCYNIYDKCDRIPNTFCTDFRYKSKLVRLCNKHCGCHSIDSRRKRSIDQFELSFLDILALSSKEIARYRRDDDAIDYFTTLNDLNSRTTDVFSSLAAMSGKVKALNDSYNSFEVYLNDLEEATLDEDVYKPFPCLCASKDVFNLHAIRCFNDPAVECELCSESVCGAWSKWSLWSACSKSCGRGKRSRDRTFTWYDDTKFIDVEADSCNTELCPNWGAWKPWSPCSQPCYQKNKAEPIQNRYRCWNIDEFEDCGSGLGHVHFDYDERTCNTNNQCAAICEWSDWGQWNACNPDCKKGLRIRRRTNNEESENASCTGISLESELCGDNSDDDCEECFDKYDKCSLISTSFCTDTRYAAKMKSLCHKHCGCKSRKRRSQDGPSITSPMIDENESDEIQSLELIALAMTKLSSNESSLFENSSRLRRSAEFESSNEVFSIILERFDQIDDFFADIKSKIQLFMEKEQDSTSRLKSLEIQYGRCSCSSTDINNLSAEYCDKNGNCEPCDNTISCGYFSPWTSWSACSNSCGGGFQERQQEFISDTINSDIIIEKRACMESACQTLDNSRRPIRNRRINQD